MHLTWRVDRVSGRTTVAGVTVTDEQGIKLSGLRLVEESPTVMKPMNEEHLAVLRRHMVEVIAIHADLASEELGKATLDERVMAAMRRVLRHRFVPAPFAPYAYQDMPLPIGFDKTISQPFIVALMTDLLAPQPHEAVLEIGTGLGYQTAILAELAGQVWSVEIIEEFAGDAEALLQGLGSSNVGIRVGDGSRGWPEHSRGGVDRNATHIADQCCDSNACLACAGFSTILPAVAEHQARAARPASCGPFDHAGVRGP